MKAHGAHGVYQYYAGGGGGALSGGSYIVTATDPNLTNEFLLTASNNIQITTAAGIVYLTALTPTVIAQSGGTVYATSGAYYVLAQTNSLLPNSKQILAGTNVILRTDATTMWIDADTGAAAAAKVYAATGAYYYLSQTDASLPNAKTIIASNNIILRTDATSLYIEAQTGAGSQVWASSNAYYITSQTDGNLANYKVLTASNNIITSTGAGVFYIEARTPTVIAQSGGTVYASTGAYYLTSQTDTTFANEKVLTASNNIVLRTDAGAMYIEAQTGAPVGTNVQDRMFTFFAAGNMSTNMLVEKVRYYIPFNFEVRDCRLAVTTSASGSAIQVDINQYASPELAGVSIYTNVASIPALSYVSQCTDFSVTTLYAGSYLGIDIDAVGSTINGSNLTLTLVARTS